MRLSKIEIIHFGKLNDLTISLDKNLDVFLGNNEAGKSTIVAFIKQVLFGFHLKSKKSKFFEDYFPLNHVSPMGGSLFFQDENQEYVLKRLYAKGDSKKGVLTVTLNGREVPATVFYDHLKNIEDSFYTDSFIFNQDLLAEIVGLTEEELVERIYFLGASQSGKLLELRDKYATEASNLFKPTGKRPIINQILSQIKDQEEKVKASAEQYEEYRNLIAKKEKFETKLGKLQKYLAQLKQEQQDLEILKTKEKNFQEYQTLKQEYQPIEFSQELFDKIKSLNDEINQESQKLLNLKEELNKAQLGKDSINLDQAQSLIDQKAEFLQWESELNTLKSRIKQLNDKEESLKNIQPELKKLEKLDDASIAQLRQDYRHARQESQKQVNSINVVPVAISGLVLVLGLIIMLAQNNFFIGGLLTLAGIIAGIYFLRPQAPVTTYQDQFKQNYPFDIASFDLDSSLQQLVSLKQQEQEKLTNQNVINELVKKINTFISQLEICLNQQIGDKDQALTALNSLQRIIQVKKDREFVKQNLLKQINEVELKVKDNEQKLSKLLLKSNCKSLDELKNQREEYLKQEKIKLKLDTLKNNLEDDLEDLEKYHQENQLSEKLAKVSEEISQQNKIITQQQQELADINAQQNNLVDSDEVINQSQKLANLRAQLEKESIDYMADLVVAEWVNRSLDIASNERFPKMLQSAKKYFNLLTDGRYIDINFNKDLTVKNKDNKKYKVQYLSRGTSEQLYFALKLAFVEQVADEISLPVLIDDAFVNFDKQRIDNIIKLIKKLSQHTQVLIFTQRKELAEAMNCQVIDLNQEN